MIKHVVPDFNELDRFNKLNLINSFFVVTALASAGPVLIKLQGVYFSVFILTLINLGNVSSGLIQKIFENISLLVKYRLMWAGNVLTSISFFIIFIDEFLFISIFSILAVIEATLVGAFMISFNNFLSKAYSSQFIKISIARSFISSLSNIIGLIIIGVSSFFLEGKYALIPTMILIVPMMISQYYFDKSLRIIKTY